MRNAAPALVLIAMLLLGPGRAFADPTAESCVEACRAEARLCADTVQADRRDCNQSCRDEERGSDRRACRQTCRDEASFERDACRDDQKTCRQACSEP